MPVVVIAVFITVLFIVVLKGNEVHYEGVFVGFSCILSS
jgi:hypothetical protein